MKMMKLILVPKEEFERVRSHGLTSEVFLPLCADMNRANALMTVKRAGSGHLGSSFSAMDIVTHLYYREMNTLTKGLASPERDIYFSSKGHDVPGLYALLYSVGILTVEKILALRRLGGLDGHPDVNIPGIEANSGSGDGHIQRAGNGLGKKTSATWRESFCSNR
jgi:transketolase